MENYRSVWDILELEPTTDKKKIKQAYARLSRTCHPEEHPEEFQQLHDAYEAALRTANLLEQREHTSDTDHTGHTSDTSRTTDSNLTTDTNQSSDSSPAQDTELSILIAQGIKKDASSRPHRLMTHIQHLHWQTPDVMTISDSWLLDDIRLWQELLGSPDFEACAYDPSFLSMLVQWFRDTGFDITRAETIAFYLFYGVPANWRTLPASPLKDLYDQIIAHGIRFEPYMYHYTGISPTTLRGPKVIKKQERQLNFILIGLALLLLLLSMLFLDFFSQNESTDSKDTRKAESSMSEQWDTDSEVIFHRESDHDISDFQQWLSDYGFTLAFPTSSDFSASSDSSADSSLSTSSGSSADTKSFTAHTPEELELEVGRLLRMDNQSLTSIRCIQNATESEPAIYEAVTRFDIFGADSTAALYRSSGTEPVTVIFRLYLDYTPSDDSYRVLADTYLPECFLTAARQNLLPGKVWVDDACQIHILLAGQAVEDIPMLAMRLCMSADTYFRYTRENQFRGTMPELNLTILHGADTFQLMRHGFDADSTAKALMEGTYQPQPDAPHTGYKLTHNPETGEWQFLPDAGFDGNRFVSHIVCGPDPHSTDWLSPQEPQDLTAAIRYLTDTLESLDWLLASQKH